MAIHGFTHAFLLSEVNGRRDLPACQGIYVLLRREPGVEGGWRILYVGRSMCLACRTRSTSHYVLEGLRQTPNLYLLLHPLPGATEAEIDRFERETIKNLRPELNRVV